MKFLIYISISVLFFAIAYTIIKLIPSFEKYLAEKGKSSDNHNYHFPFMSPPPVTISAPSPETKIINEKEEEQKSEEKMNRIFESPDFKLDVKTNFDKLGKKVEKKHNIDKHVDNIKGIK